VFVANASEPTATLFTPVVLFFNALKPKAVFGVPVVLLLNAQKPTAVLFDAVLHNNEFQPTAVRY
jgi:hypothetical protein